MNISPRFFASALALLGCALCPLSIAAVDFEDEILPILQDRCLDCHGPDKDRSSFRVDQRVAMLKGGDSGIPALVPGDPEASFLIEVVKGIDPDMTMPPKGDPLTESQITLLENWISEGAAWPGQMDQEVGEVTTEHWAFQPVIRPELPTKDHANPIDSFLSQAQREAGLSPNEAADPRSLIRRSSIILTGLPPTPERVSQFESDFAHDPDQAHDALVNELLASPHFGERWGQHWLDVIRWAETNGSEANLYRKNAWIYRDYVIRAFNEDLPYDQFVREQLAGDQLGAGEATGFLVAGPHVPAATVGREPTAIRQARADRMDEVMQTVGASMLGMTVSCARCHNHKFDPISIQDYYALTAVFQGVEFGGRYPEFSDSHPRKQRASQLYPAMFAERAKIRNALGNDRYVWTEDWGGFKDTHFPPTTTQALRIEFDWPNIRLDELDVFGPADHRKNLAHSSTGTVLKADETHTKPGSPPSRANDGKFGTMAWSAKAPKGEKAWIEIHFPEPTEVSRFRFSANREYYFETDYLTVSHPKLASLSILAQQPNGSWKKIASTKEGERLANQVPAAKDATERLHTLIGSLAEEGPRHSFVGKFIEPTTTYVFHRGSPENPRDEVYPAGFAILDGDLGLSSDTADADRRLGFAEWVTQPDHPLTARVMANRLWHHTFGSGIVPTTSDFGTAGAEPLLPELLDWLAAELVEPTQSEAAPWSMKAFIRLLVSSDAFRRSSLPSTENLTIDASSIYLWRYPPRRVEAEVIRDGILLASGKLNPAIGGRSFRIHNEKKTYAQWEVVNNSGPETWRRMIYQERMRRVDDRIFTAFDFPDCGQVRAKRPVSTTPLQALNLMNSPLVVDQSQHLAERAMQEGGPQLAGAVQRAYDLLLTRAPSAEELETCVAIAQEHGLAVICRTLLNTNEFAFLP